MPVSDGSYLIRPATADLTGSGNGPAVYLGASPFQGMLVGVSIPQATGTNPTLTLKLQESANGSDWTDIPRSVFGQFIGAGYHDRALTWTGPYVRYVATVGGSTPNFGKVSIRVVPGKGKTVKLAQTFYVDDTSGNDANDGAAPDRAWKTIAKVNAAPLLPGDSVLFKRGETWTGTALVPPTSGLPGQEITFGAYGSGAKPIIDGQSVLTGCLSTNGKNLLIIKDLNLQNAEFPLNISASHGLAVIDMEISGATGDGILCSGGAHDLVFSNIESHDHPGASGADTCFEIKDDCHDITLDGFTFYNARYGFSVHNHVPAQGNGIMPYNILIKNGTVQGTTVIAFQCIKKDDAAKDDLNIVFSDIVVSGSNATGLACQESGASPMSGVIFRRIEVYDTTEWPADLRASIRLENCVLQGGYHTVCRSYGSPTLYNCTLYRVAAKTLGTETGCEGLTMRNCIIYTEGAKIVDLATISNIDMDYNLYYCEGLNPVTGTAYNWNGANYDWADWKSQSGGDANSPTPADPLFADQDNDDFTLQTGSPAINAGVDVGLPYSGSAPDCGAYEKE